MSTDHLHIPPAPVPDDATQEMVRMRDGVRLATDVYLPDDAEPGPTILIRLPYDKDGEYTHIPPVARYMVARGYRVVAQDVRGKFRSEGETLLFVNEVEDGYDTIDWITRQPWSDGDVAMWGDSYYGYTQWAAVSSGHPALRAIAPRVTGTRLGELPEVIDESGAMEVEMAVHRLYPTTFFQSNDTYLWLPDWKRRPFTDNVEEFFATVGHRSISYDQWAPGHEVRLRRFRHGHPFDARPVPVLQTIGWWDNIAPQQWADVRELMTRPAWAGQHYLLIDSIDHEFNHLTDAGRGRERTTEEMEASLGDYLDPALEFFDVFVRRRGSADRIPRVRYHVGHTDGFRTTTSWPPPGVRKETLALTADGALAATAGEPAELGWTHDPDDLVPSPVENAFGFLQEYPDERATAERADVLCFDGEPVAADVEYVGGARFTGTVGSTGPTMDVFVRLLDVAPDGAAHLITRGQVHLPELAGPREVDVDLGQVGYRLRAGHRLRVYVASSDFPEFMPQPGNGQHPWTAVDVEPNRQTLHVGGPAGARLHLDVLASTS